MVSTPRSQVWLIEDDEHLARDVIAYWKHLAPHRFRFRHFPQALEAWKAWQQTPMAQRPIALIVDGHLDGDSGELAFGAGLIRRVHEATTLSAPFASFDSSARVHLIGFSGDILALEDMEDEGADRIFSKSEARQVLDYLVAISFERGVNFICDCALPLRSENGSRCNCSRWRPIAKCSQ